MTIDPKILDAMRSAKACADHRGADGRAALENALYCAGCVAIIAEAAQTDCESLRREADLRNAQLLAVGSELAGNSQLHWLHDRSDPRWTPTLEEAWAVKQRVKELAAQVVALMHERDDARTVDAATVERCGSCPRPPIGLLCR